MALHILGTDYVSTVDRPEDVARVYDEIGPDMILSAVSQGDAKRLAEVFLELREGASKYISDKKLLDRFMATFELGYECRFDRRYAEDRGLEHHMVGVDFPQVVDSVISRVRDTLVVFEEGGDEVNYLDWVERVEESHRREGERVGERVRFIVGLNGTVRSEIMLLGLRALGHIGPRDEFMARRVRELYDPDKTVVFPVGVASALDSYFGLTLYSKLKDLKPERGIV